MTSNTVVHIEQVQNLRKIIRSCGMTVPPTVYKKAKQQSDSKRVVYLLQELTTILKEGFSTNPTNNEATSVTETKASETDLSVNSGGEVKVKEEAGLWLEEMEMSAMEDNSALSEVSFAGTSEFMLNSNSVCQTKIHGASDDPSNINELKETVAMQGPSGNYTNLSHNRDNGISTSGQVPMGIVGGNENIQQPTMPVWPGQPPQDVQNFKSHMVGSGPTVQGFHGLPVQGIQIGSPYYQSYFGNSYWPQFNPLFHPTQMSELSGMSTEVGSPGSPRSAS